MAEQVKLPHLHLTEAIRQVATSKNFTDYTHEIYPGAPIGQNYLGEVYRVILKDKNGDRTLNIIVKGPPPTDSVRTHIPIDVLYSRESYTYNTIFKVYKELQDSSKVNDEWKFYWPECYMAVDKQHREVVVLEDLQMQNFEPMERKMRVDLDHALLMVGSLAKMHALSFVLQKMDNSRFSTIVQEVPDFTRNVKSFTSYAERSLDLAIRSLEDSELKQKLTDAKKKYFEIMKETHVDDYSVISHNDSWIGNGVFKYKNGKPTEMRLLDYQMVRYGPASVDVLYFLFTSTDGDFRKAHYEEVLRHYYNTLKKCLSVYGIEIDNIFPEKEFYKQVRANALYGLVAGIVFSKPMTSPADQAMDLKEMLSTAALTAPKGQYNKEYLKKINEIVQDCITHGYI